MKILKKLLNVILSVPKRIASWYQSILKLNWWQKLIYFDISFMLMVFMLLMLALMKQHFKWLIYGLIIVFLIIRFIYWRNNVYLKKKTSGNVFIFGAKGDGKDLTMQLSVIKKYKGWFNRHRRKPLTNIKDGHHYGYGTQYESPKKVFDLSPNTYKNYQ